MVWSKFINLEFVEWMWSIPHQLKLVIFGATLLIQTLIELMLTEI